LNAAALQSKTLSLELLVSIMQNPGPMFITRPEFKEVVKDHLCDSILKNSVSTDKPVFSYSLGIFISLVFFYAFNECLLKGIIIGQEF
jgi:brefeldin A-inhibited guanine nucleotide-exchange protein